MTGTLAQDRFLELEMRAEVWLANEEVPLERLLALQPGGTLPLARDPDGPVQLVVNGSVIASGELIVVDGKFAFRVTASDERELAGLAGTPPVEPAAPATTEAHP